MFRDVQVTLGHSADRRAPGSTWQVHRYYQAFLLFLVKQKFCFVFFSIPTSGSLLRARRPYQFNVDWNQAHTPPADQRLTNHLFCFFELFCPTRFRRPSFLRGSEIPGSIKIRTTWHEGQSQDQFQDRPQHICTATHVESSLTFVACALTLTVVIWPLAEATETACATFLASLAQLKQHRGLPLATPPSVPGRPKDGGCAAKSPRGAPVKISHLSNLVCSSVLAVCRLALCS